MIKNEINNIQGLRAFAAILVVLVHTLVTTSSYGYEPKLFFFLKGWGVSGVDLFFVISGFIMVYIQQRKISTPLKFISNRFLRIAPLYWALSVSLFIIFKLAPTVFNSPPPDISFLISSLFFSARLQGYGTPLLFDGWTLEYEMLFYCLFAISLLFKEINKTIIFTNVAILLWFWFAGNSIVLEFSLGMLIGWLYVSNRASIENGAALFTIGTTLFFITILFMGAEINIDRYRFFLFGLPSALIVCGAVWMKQIKISVLTKIGDASYSIYLVQIFTIPAYFKVIKSVKLPAVYSDIYIVGCVVLAVISGHVLYIYFEKNAERFLLPLKNLIR